MPYERVGVNYHVLSPLQQSIWIFRRDQSITGNPQVTMNFHTPCAIDTLPM